MSNNYKKTIVLGLDYSEFSGGIAECNRKMGLLDSSMKLASEQAKGFGDETDQLRIKQEGLSQKIILQKKIVEEHAQAYDKAMTKYNGTGKEVDRLDKTLLNARTTLQKYENELKDTTKRLEDMEDASEDVDKTSRSFGDTIRDVAEAVGVEASPVVEKLAEHFDGLDENIGKAVLTSGTLVTTLGALSLQTAEQAKQVINVSQTMGMTTDQYQTWDYILKTVGYDAESASGDLAALAEKAKDAAEGGNDSAKTFQELGISVKNSRGELKSQNELFTELIFSLMNMEDATKRNAIASDLLSTTGEKIVPILNMSRQEFYELAKQAHETGYVMSEEMLKSAYDTSGSMEQLNAKMDALKYTLGSVMLPILETFVDILNAIPTPVLTGISVFAGLMMVLGPLGKAITTYQMQALLASAANTALGTTGAAATAGLSPLLAILIALAAVIALIVGGAAALDDALSSANDAANATIANAQNSYNVNRPKYNARGTEYFEGGRTWIGEEGAELIDLPPGTRIYNHRESRRIGQSGNTYFYVTIDAKNVKEFNDIVRIAENERRSFRIGRVRG